MKKNHLLHDLLPTEIEGVDSLAELALDMGIRSILHNDYQSKLAKPGSFWLRND
jgi:hypothetical protein